MIIVIDTNVLVRETHLLRKKGGPLLLQLLHATNGQLLIPEILRRECVEQSVLMANEGRSEVSTSLNRLTTLLGVRLENPLPGEEAARASVIARLRSLEALTLSEALTPELLAVAGNRVLAGHRPTTKTDHGYKDCLIWESVLRLPADSQVRLISKDKAFFEGDAIHPELLAEARARNIHVIGYREIQRAVEELENANPNLNLMALHTRELVEPAAEPVEIVGAPAAAPALAGAQPPAADLDEVTRRLAEAERRFHQVALKVLAYIAYLDSASKTDTFDALADADVAPDLAKNVAERLVITGFVRDTGNHFLIADRVLRDLVAPTVEADIIAWLQRNPVAP